MSINKAILVGNVGQKPEIRVLDGGSKVASFSIATTDRAYKTAAGVEVPERTEWHNVVAWKGLADIAEKYIDKGSQLYIEGKLSTRKWDKDGVTHYSTSIIAENIQLLGKKDSNGSEKPNDSKEPEFPTKNDDDDLPF